jgi:hypothetical protein
MFHDLVPIAGMVTGVMITGLVTWCFVSVFRGPVGQALGRRIGGHHDHVEDEVLELRDVVAGLADDLRETQERLEFTERMLSAGSDRGAPVIEETGSTSTDGI